MWREWSRVQKFVVVVGLVLLAWYAIGATVKAVQLATSQQATSGNLQNAFLPWQPIPGYNPGGSGSFSCIVDPLSFAQCVNNLITQALASFFTTIQTWVGNFFVSIVTGIGNAATSALQFVLNSITNFATTLSTLAVALIQSFLGWVSSIAQATGPFAPIVTIIFVGGLLVAGSVALYFASVLLFSLIKLIISLL